jgi:site-specific DNA recombinase
VSSDRVLRAAVYARVSTLEQAKTGTSLGAQVEVCRRFAESQGWVVVGEFVDEGVSGTLGSRPRLDALFSAVRSDEVDVVVVGKLDRFARSMKHLSAMIGELDDRGVLFATVDRQIDTTTSAGRLLRNILGSFAEFERDLIVERTNAGKRKVVADGFWPGAMAPFGWRRDRSHASHTRLVIDEDQAEVYRLIVHLLVDRGYTTSETARHLNGLGIPTPRGLEWHPQRVRQLLMRAPLSGEWTYGRPRPSRPRIETPLVTRIPAIISAERHAELRRVLACSSTGPRDPAHLRVYLLGRGRLFGPCGGKYFGVWIKERGYSQYRCANNVPGRLRCACHRVYSDDIDRAVWAALAGFLGDAGRLVSAAQAFAESRAPRLDGDLGSRLGSARRALTLTVIEYAKAQVPADALQAATTQLRREIENLERERAEATAWIKARDAAEARTDRLVAMARVAPRRLQRLTTPERSRVLALLEATVTITAWRTCAACGARGKATGQGRGRSCQPCRGTRYAADFKIDGKLSDRAIDQLGDRRRQRTNASTLAFPICLCGTTVSSLE